MPSRAAWAWRSLGQLLRVAEGRGMCEGRSTKAEVWRLASRVLMNVITMVNRIAQIEPEQVRRSRR